jgi:hypothetical protein
MPQVQEFLNLTLVPVYVTIIIQYGPLKSGTHGTRPENFLNHGWSMYYSIEHQQCQCNMMCYSYKILRYQYINNYMKHKNSLSLSLYFQILIILFGHQATGCRTCQKYINTCDKNNSHACHMTYDKEYRVVYFKHG